MNEEKKTSSHFKKRKQTFLIVTCLNISPKYIYCRFETFVYIKEKKVDGYILKVRQNFVYLLRMCIYLCMYCKKPFFVCGSFL